MQEIQSSNALIKKVTVNEDKSGVDLELELQPSLKKAAARLAWAYVGNGFGIFALPKVEDEILVVFPDGDISQGIVVSRLSSRIDKVPDGISDEKILLIVEDGVDLEMTVTGTVKLICDDIRLGNGIVEKIVKESFKATYDGHIHQAGGSGPPTAPMPGSDLTSDLKAC